MHYNKTSHITFSSSSPLAFIIKGVIMSGTCMVGTKLAPVMLGFLIHPTLTC